MMKREVERQQTLLRILRARAEEIRKSEPNVTSVELAARVICELRAVFDLRTVEHELQQLLADELAFADAGRQSRLV